MAHPPSHIVTHANCADGTASAMILKAAYPDARVTFLQYETEEHKNLKAEEGMLFCDFSPPKDRVQQFIDVGAVVLDHHRFAKGIVEQFGDNGVFADEATEPGVSGAVLAFREVEIAVTPGLREFAELVGIRDTWQKDHPRWREACELSAALHFYPWADLPPVMEWRTLQPIGHILFEKQLADARQAVEKAYRFTTPVNGTKVAMINGVTLTSDAAEILGDTVDMVVGFKYDITPPQEVALIFSTRSHAGYDVGAFCSAQGGGGHTAAAGFRTGNQYDNPFDTFQDILGEYEALQQTVQRLRP